MVKPCMFVALVAATSAAAQTPDPAVGFTRSAGADPVPARPAAQAPITPEIRGDIYMARKMYREAVDSYRESPETAILVNKMGIGYHQMMDFGRAQKHYEKAIKLKPDYSEAINNLGTIHYARKSYRRAVNTYKKALLANPNSASIHSNLGTAYFARKKYADALISYQKALDLDPDVFEHRGTHGVLLQERSVTERAKFHYYLSKMYAKQGNLERALQYMRKSIEEGFKDRQKFAEEPEFAALRLHPEFETLMKMENRVL